MPNLRPRIPRLTRSLNGTWHIARGSASTASGPWNSTVPVPALVDAATPPYDWSAAQYHWYHSSFALSKEERSYISATLRIEQAMFGTQVWLNGTLLGEDIACYTSQEYDATAALKLGENELLIRVGRRDRLPQESAVGKDQERTTFIPGIWGDVMLVFSGMPRVQLVQVIPHIGSSTAEVRVTLENRSVMAVRVRVISSIRKHRGISSRTGERAIGKDSPGNNLKGKFVARDSVPHKVLAGDSQSGKIVAGADSPKNFGRKEWTGKTVAAPKGTTRTVPAGETIMVKFLHRIRAMHLWSPEDPFLYDHVVRLETPYKSGGVKRDSLAGESAGEPSAGPEDEALNKAPGSQLEKGRGRSSNESLDEALEGSIDEVLTRFGMREFRATRSGFFLNGKRIFLRGGNIAFHRFLSDKDRGTLPWDLTWIRKALIDIPKRHNFNFFRNHLGQMYNRWYDFADDGGMLLQNEWQFWTVSGTKEQITKEFTRWLQDNWNHPSIVIWDPLNESSDETVQREIVPAMKRLDPTRPWESVDFLEEHPYIYSLGPVLIDRRFGFTRSLQEIERSRRPTMLNEFLWWWLDKEGKPTPLTQEVVERWLGPHTRPAEILEHQAFLARELVDLFRRMGVDAIQPFAYLTCNEGPTSHWFLGDIAELRPKPVLQALREAFAPFGVSIELWDRHFYRGEKRAVRVFLFNDRPGRSTGTLRFGVLRTNGTWVARQTTKESVRGSATKIVRLALRMPRKPGDYSICAELVEEGKVVTRSVKPAFVFGNVGRDTVPSNAAEAGDTRPPLQPEDQARLYGAYRATRVTWRHWRHGPGGTAVPSQQARSVLLRGGTPELRKFLRELGIRVKPLTTDALAKVARGGTGGARWQDVLVASGEATGENVAEEMRDGHPLVIVNGGAVRDERYAAVRKKLTESVEAGGTLVLLEPEYGVVGRDTVPSYQQETTIEVLDGVKISIKRREDADRGGYDSHVFMEDPAHPLWKGIKREHLRFFNGGFGGEIVSQHDVVPQVEHTVLARCGLGLRVIAAAEITLGKGRVMMFRLQLRGRLGGGKSSSSLYARRPDPVAQRLMRNLLEYGGARG